MEQYISCSNCEGEVTEESDFCPHCGYILADRLLYCDVHKKNESAGMCIICGRSVCEQCGEENDRRVFCLEHLDVHVDGDWAEVFRSTNPAESEVARTLLEELDIAVESGSAEYEDERHAPGHAVSPIRLFVLLHQYIKAKQALDEWRRETRDNDSFN